MRIRNLPFVLLALATAHAHATYFDGETGMLDNGYRTLAPRDGRYIQPDPVRMHGGPNPFSYVDGNPLQKADPLGLCPMCLVPALPYIPELAVIGATWWAGQQAAQLTPSPVFAKPPENAFDPKGPKAPGKPGSAEGFFDPKGGENWVPNPNPGRGGSSYGWQDDSGRVWCPTGQGGRAHGGPHWDVQLPDGRHANVPPGQNINDLLR